MVTMLAPAARPAPAPSAVLMGASARFGVACVALAFVWTAIALALV